MSFYIGLKKIPRKNTEVAPRAIYRGSLWGGNGGGDTGGSLGGLMGRPIGGVGERGSRTTHAPCTLYVCSPNIFTGSVLHRLADQPHLHQFDIAPVVFFCFLFS